MIITSYFPFLIFFLRITNRAFFYLKYQVINISYQLLEQKAYAINCDKIEIRSNKLFKMTFSKLWEKRLGERFAIELQYIEYELIHLQ